MELLGDSVLSLITVEWIYEEYPDLQEGKLSKIKSYLVSESVLTQIAFDLNLGAYLRLGKGEKAMGGNLRESTLANLAEALLASIYIDQGLKEARNWILPYLKGALSQMEDPRDIRDNKSALQEYSQKKWKLIPVYNLVSEIGSDHEKTFTVEVSLENKRKAKGNGSSKQRAEQEAAKRLLLKIKSKQ